MDSLVTPPRPGSMSTHESVYVIDTDRVPTREEIKVSTFLQNFWYKLRIGKRWTYFVSDKVV